MMRLFPPSLLLLTTLLAVPTAADDSLPGAEVLLPGVTLNVLDGVRQGVDESGLRYYVSVGDMDAAEAELRRLSALYPDWRPPRDLLMNPWGGTNERPVWDLLAAGRVDDARKAADALRAATPSWQPSPELAQELDRHALRRTLAEWEAAGDWAAIRKAVQARTGDTGCQTPDIAWVFAEALARTGALTVADHLAERLVRTCPEFKARITTMQKASAWLPYDGVDRLLQIEAQRPLTAEERQHLDAVQDALRQGELGKLLSGASPWSGPAAIAAMERATTARRDGQSAVLLGWWHYEKRRYDTASTWFDQAASWLPGRAEPAEGQVVTALALGKRDAAKKLMTQWRGASPRIAELENQIAAKSAPPAPPNPTAKASKALDQGRTTDCLDMTAAAADKVRADPGMALIRAWCLYRLDRFDEAGGLFNQALALPNLTDAARRDAAYGAALLAMRQDDPAAVESLMKRHPLGAEHERELRAQLVAKQAERAYKDGRYQEFLDMFEQRARLGAPPNNLLMLKGWSLHLLGRRKEAVAIFEDLDRARSTAETRRALDIVRRVPY